MLYCFTCKHLFFYKLKVCGNPLSIKSIGAISSKAFAHFVYLSHFCNTWNISNFLLLCLLWWSLILLLQLAEGSGDGYHFLEIKHFKLIHVHCFCGALVAQMVKSLLAMQETRVQTLGQEGPLEKGMATHSSISVWRIPWTEEPSRLRSTGSQRVRPHWVTDTFTFFTLFL